MSASSTEAWTTRRLLDWIREAFEKAGLDSARLSAEILLAHVLGCDRLRLYMDPDRPASAEERETLRGLVRRALAQEPIQYLVGTWSFFGMEIACDGRALIPRPSTETLIEHVLQHAKRGAHGGGEPPLRRIADVGTGTGCIALALARHVPVAEVIATDISADALALARENAARHGLGKRIEFREGDLLEPLAGEVFDLIASNPPYIPDDEWHAVAANVKDYEPELALRGGADGNALVGRLIAGAPPLLSAGGWMLIEVAASRAEEAASLVATDGRYDGVEVLEDCDGLPRVVVARRGR